MAISIVSTGSDIVQNATQTVECPAPGTINIDDVLFFRVYCSDDVDITCPETGVVKIGQSQGATGTDHAVAAFYKVAGGSELSAFTFNIAGGNNRTMAAVCTGLDGVDTINPMDATRVLLQDQNGTTVDLSAITTATNGAWVFNVFGAILASIGTPSGAPTGYTTNGIITSSNHYVGTAYKEVAVAGSEDPGAWGAFGAAVDWSGLTIAFKPAGAAVGSLPIFRRRGR